MNCAECQIDPLTPGHYCPCCGRQLSLQERRAVDASAAGARCQSCGGPSADGELCKSCRQAFAPVLANATAPEPPDHSATAVRQEAPAAEQKAVERKAPVIVKTRVTVSPVTAPPATVPPADVSEDALKTEVSRSETAKAIADFTARAHLARAGNPSPITSRPIVSSPAPSQPPQPQGRTSMWIKAAAVIVVAIAAAESARRFGFLSQQTARDEQPVQAAPVVEGAAAPEPVATPSATRSASKVVAENRAPAASPSKAAALSKPTTAAGRRRPIRPEPASAQHAARVVPPAPVPVPEAPAPVPTERPALVAVAEAPAQPTGRFFERSDVDEPPRIATRIEPQIPAAVAAREQNDVVVVRVLVSRTGHPFRVSLLRGSRSGRSSDEAVVAAVTRWTFSPARKRGEPVNCWYNIGVPLGQTN